MQRNSHIPHIYKPLLPLAWIYNAGVWTRNRLFDCGILPVEEFSIPIISVGNIAVGGTGKTPMIEHLIELLSPHARIAVLSRGYRRKSRGFVPATAQSTPQELGDEPYQIHRKYSRVMVAVDGNRRRGIRQLLQTPNPPQIILLDDAHQHRYVRPTLSIVLSDYNRPPYADHLLPAGRLREPMSGLKRADMVVLTKCNRPLTAEDYIHEAHHMHIATQQLYAAQIDYRAPYHAFSLQPTEMSAITANKVAILTGIANPQPLVSYIGQYTSHTTLLEYPDHHNFSDSDLQHIEEHLKGDTNTILITTEKDAARLQAHNLSPLFKSRCYVLPMKTTIQPTPWAPDFDSEILKILSIASQ